MSNRRQALNALGALALGGLAGSIPRAGHTAGEEYRALVVVLLEGGNDGHNTLVPTDAGYGDYERSRGALALPRDSLVALPGRFNDRSLGMHPGLSTLLPAFNDRRLAFLANVGVLEKPLKAADVQAGSALPPAFLGLHDEQESLVQGGTAEDNAQGWAGRALEALPADLRHANAGVTMAQGGAHTLVQGSSTAATYLPERRQSWWGWGDAIDPSGGVQPALRQMSRWQTDNAYAAEYQRNAARALEQMTFVTRAFEQTPEINTDYGNNDTARRLRTLARTLPYFKREGLRRQVFFLREPNFDTHIDQRGTFGTSQDTQLGNLSRALASYDAQLRSSGLDANVVTLVMSEFGRTLRPGSPTGSEHGWGSHWWALGGPVAGGDVLGSFPSLVLGGADDADAGSNGTGSLVPTMAADQVAAALVQWLGLPASELVRVLPNLTNFTQKSVPLIRS